MASTSLSNSMYSQLDSLDSLKLRLDSTYNAVLKLSFKQKAGSPHSSRSGHRKRCTAVWVKGQKLNYILCPYTAVQSIASIALHETKKTFVIKIEMLQANCMVVSSCFVKW
jgi:hypothetical protein